MYFVYILQSGKDGSFYTGMTENLSRRVHEHNAGHTPSTRHKAPFKLVHQERMKREAKQELERNSLKQVPAENAEIQS